MLNGSDSNNSKRDQPDLVPSTTIDSADIIEPPNPDEPKSPLWMVTQDDRLNELVYSLSKLESHDDSSGTLELQFSRRKLEEARAAFSEVIRQGEKGLHQLCQLFCSKLLNSYQIESVVIGQVATNKERFTMLQYISPEDLYSTIDLDLGNRQLAKLKMWDGTEWSNAELVANVVQYEPTGPQEHNIHKVISRIKAEEEIWNKVADEIFHLDQLVARDKELRHLSSFVKDIFGIKFVVASDQAAYALQNSLENLQFLPEQLGQIGLEYNEQTSRLNFLELKDYLSHSSKKRSGWEAVKSVTRWADKTFEIQIQPLPNFLMERERLTRESHQEFKLTRESVRNSVAEKYPLFGYCRDLLHWLFRNANGLPPGHPGIVIKITD